MLPKFTLHSNQYFLIALLPEHIYPLALARSCPAPSVLLPLSSVNMSPDAVSADCLTDQGTTLYPCLQATSNAGFLLISSELWLLHLSVIHLAELAVRMHID